VVRRPEEDRKSWNVSACSASYMGSMCWQYQSWKPCCKVVIRCASSPRWRGASWEAQKEEGQILRIEKACFGEEAERANKNKDRESTNGNG
jgi:hypothetical protein